MLETRLFGGGKYPQSLDVSTVVIEPGWAAHVSSGTEVSSRHVHWPGRLDPVRMHMTLLDGHVVQGVVP